MEWTLQSKHYVVHIHCWEESIWGVMGEGAPPPHLIPWDPYSLLATLPDSCCNTWTWSSDSDVDAWDMGEEVNPFQVMTLARMEQTGGIERNDWMEWVSMAKMWKWRKNREKVKNRYRKQQDMFKSVRNYVQRWEEVKQSNHNHCQKM